MGKMLKVTRKRKRKERSVRWIVRGTGFLVLFFTALIAVFAIHNTNLWNRLQYQICYQMLKQYAPLLASGSAVQSSEKFMNVVRKYLSIEELTHTLLREMVEKIVVYECEYDENEVRHQRIDIYYSFVGKIDLPEE